MNRCEANEPPYAVSVRSGLPYDGTGDQPSILCIDAADNSGSTSPTFDPASGYCKWIGPDAQPGFALVYQVCQPPPIDFEALGITGDEMAYVWAFGVASVLTLWSIGYTLGLATGLIRKA